eukprot:9827632-Ditylum_brightwellii.AAC.1
MTAAETAVSSQAPPLPPGFCPLKPLPGLQREVIGAFGWSPYPNLFLCHCLFHVSPTTFPTNFVKQLCHHEFQHPQASAL